MLIDPVTGELVLPLLRTPYNYDMDAVSRETGLDCDDEDEPDRTVQSFKEECDINTIVHRFGLTGELPANARAPEYGDFSEVMDYQTALNAVQDADRRFMEFPADTRAEFDNDPQKMMAFLANDANRAKAEELGLINKAPAEPAPIRVRVEPDPAAPAAGAAAPKTSST